MIKNFEIAGSHFKFESEIFSAVPELTQLIRRRPSAASREQVVYTGTLEVSLLSISYSPLLSSLDSGERRRASEYVSFHLCTGEALLITASVDLC